MESSIRGISIFWKLSRGMENDMYVYIYTHDIWICIDIDIIYMI